MIALNVARFRWTETLHAKNRVKTEAFFATIASTDSSLYFDNLAQFKHTGDGVFPVETGRSCPTALGRFLPTDAL
jgi:hypothetical protein